MPVKFSWEYFWLYYQNIGNEVVQRKMREEVLLGDWLFSQPVGAQVEVLKDAPKEFIDEIQDKLNPETLRILKPTTLIDWSKI